MHLEFARALHSYGVTLLKHGSMEQKNHQQGLSYLRDAYKIFDECGAAVDSQLVEHDIAVHQGQREK